MVAGTLPEASRSSYRSPLVEAASALPRRFGKVKLTIDDALAMVAAGVLPEDASIELIDGELEYVDRRTARGGDLMEGPDHNLVIALIAGLAPRIGDAARHLRTQSTFVCSPTHSPIPDASILRGSVRDYVELPQAGDALSIIEVAGSSYPKDAGVKLAAYARAGVPQYVILNLNNRTAEVHTQPDVAAGTYATKITVPADGTLAIRVGDAGETFDVPLAELLP